MDRIQWQRTSWLAGSICASWCWGKLPQKIFSINLDYKHPVSIHGGGGQPVVFDAAKNQYTSDVQVEVPFHRFKLRLRDTGVSLFNTHIAQHLQRYDSRDEAQFRLYNRVVDGFLENESAFHRLALSREVNMLGLGGSVYRQTLWSAPALPNLATAVDADAHGTLFQHYFGCDPVGGPVATWLCHEIPRTFIYQMEGEVEDENDPNSATTYGDRSLTERVQKKAMNRYNDFRSEVRHKTYSDIAGSEVPR
ncbi:hypothetical protein STCU_00285 [Strigomonas culicis]|uniref:Uncharacterized protein n=1 Tax=Strigomonas culicis TaxID=28005 RepID=S9V861_9TRYP|nr:hypothetical protein STCU_07845 [Strigomonas culicis]EPY37013.1 hypothetical protein STCU_00285 [Strigomonas culicis]|eukprot:EPY23151.1 hypothetical protein STCU_07845 [Strigomonas culicis]